MAAAIFRCNMRRAKPFVNTGVIYVIRVIWWRYQIIQSSFYERHIDTRSIRVSSNDSATRPGKAAYEEPSFFSSGSIYMYMFIYLFWTANEFY